MSLLPKGQLQRMLRHLQCTGMVDDISTALTGGRTLQWSCSIRSLYMMTLGVTMECTSQIENWSTIMVCFLATRRGYTN